MRRVINIDEIELVARSQAIAASGPAAERFDGRSGAIASRIGAQKLGYNLTAVPPGKRAFPFHNHHVNEEMFFILDGEGELRIGNERHPLRRGDFVACPPGGPELAHQIVNTGTTELKYLAVSTQQFPDICQYPDSGKFLVAERQRTADGSVSGFRFIGRPGSAVGYWDGE